MRATLEDLFAHAVREPTGDMPTDTWSISVVGARSDPSWSGEGADLPSAADACRQAIEATR